MSISSMVQSESQTGLLRNSLRANAIFSAASALLFTLASGPVAAFMGIPYDVALLIIGIGLFPWAYMVYRAATETPLQLTAVRAILSLDVIWVIGSYVFLLVAWSTLTVAGKWFVALQAEAVFLFALFQFIGWRRINRGEQ